MAAQHHECSEQEIDFLFRVIDEGKIEFVRWAMEQGVDPNLESPKSGATLLTEAISALQPAIVELLVQYGADPEFADDEGITPLELAQKTGNPAMIACMKKPRWKRSQTTRKKPLKKQRKNPPKISRTIRTKRLKMMMRLRKRKIRRKKRMKRTKTERPTLNSPSFR